MSSIRSKNTQPELIIRKILWNLGYRYRVHDEDVFGKPDITFRKNKMAIFIDGCFWHGCKKCYKKPKSNTSYWDAKMISNKKRRRKVKQELIENGWVALEFWEHQINSKPERIVKRIIQNL